jgi:PAS domain S-box-containing protein
MDSGPDYRELIEHVGDMIYTLDLDGHFTYVNSAGLSLLGYRAKEILGRHFSDVLSPESAKVARDHFARGLANTETTPFFEVQVIRSDGARVDVEVRAGGLYREGELIGRQGVARDISALKQLQSEVVDKSQRLALLEDQARIAMDLYRRIADLTLGAGADPEGAERTLRRVEGTLARAAAEQLGLDAQDVEIARLLARGCSNREIGEQVHLSLNTIKDRVAKLMRILGGRTRAQVAAQAVRQGLLPADTPRGSTSSEWMHP